MSAQQLQQASALMAVAATTLAQTQGHPVDLATASQVLLNAAVATGEANPNLVAAMALGSAVMSAVHVAQASGQPITADALKALFVADDAARVADAAAQAAAAAGPVSA